MDKNGNHDIFQPPKRREIGQRFPSIGADLSSKIPTFRLSASDRDKAQSWRSARGRTWPGADGPLWIKKRGKRTFSSGADWHKKLGSRDELEPEECFKGFGLTLKGCNTLISLG
jgi:hypothetical protein